MSSEYKYDVFISYKHAPLDIAVSSKIQKKLEHYRLSKEIKKKTGKKKIERVFRDQEELSAGVDLGAEIDEQLKQSEFFLVICSRESKKSIWVQRELQMFLTYHTMDHVIPVILDGEPEEVFPDQLLQYGEPFAIDLRAESTKGILKRIDKEFYKLLAPILHCSYDELVQRQKRYQMQRIGIFASAVAFVLMLFSGYALIQNQRLNNSYRKTQLQEAKLLTERAQFDYENGDYISALENLSDALPTEEHVRPFWPAAQYLMTEITNIYGNETDRSTITRLQKEVNWSSDNLVMDPEERYLFTQYSDRIDVWDAKTLKRAQKILVSRQDFMDIKRDLFLGQNQVVIGSEYMIYCYDYVTGKQIWKTKFPKQITQIIPHLTDSKIYVFDGNTIYTVRPDDGRITDGRRIEFPEGYEILKETPMEVNDSWEEIYFVAGIEEKENSKHSIWAYSLQSGKARQISSEIKGYKYWNQGYCAIQCDKNMVYYCSVNSSDDYTDYLCRVCVYDSKTQTTLWEKECIANNDDKVKLVCVDSSDTVEKDMLIFFVGDMMYAFSREEGEEIYSVMLNGNAVATYRGTYYLYVASSYGFYTGYDYNLGSIKVRFQAYTPMKAIWRSASGVGDFVLSEAGYLERYERFSKGDQAKTSTFYAAGGDGVSSDTFYMKGENAFYQTYSAFQYKEGDAEAKTIELESGYMKDWEYDGSSLHMRKAKDENNDQYRILTYHLDSGETEEEILPIDDQPWLMKQYAISQQNANGRGYLNVYDRENKTKETYLYGHSGMYGAYFSANEAMDRLLILDEGQLQLRIIDMKTHTEINSISLRDWSSSIFYALKKQEYEGSCLDIEWSKDGEYFTIYHQKSIFVYDKNGEKKLEISYKEDGGYSTGDAVPFAMISPDNEYLYYIFCDKLYQISMISGEILNEEELPIELDSSDSLKDDQKYVFEEDRLSLIIKEHFFQFYTKEDQFGKITHINDALYYDQENQRVYAKRYVEPGYEIYYYNLYSLDEIMKVANEFLGEEEAK